ERIDIVPWHPDPEIFARRALAPAKVAKVISDSARRVITAIVDEDQLSLAIGRNGQNVRLASQLIGWQIDLYGSREWLERGADAALFGGGEQDYEVADFPLRELELPLGTLAALETAGYTTFLDIIDLEKEDLLRVSGISAEQADEVLSLIESLTVEEGAAEESPAVAGGPTEAELAEARELAADILGLPLPETRSVQAPNAPATAGPQASGLPAPSSKGESTEDNAGVELEDGAA
ncbi:MAG: hypothetical protein ACRELX_07625, partial [Longimicrobiales bacterium]